MTPAQTKLLIRLIEADREYRASNLSSDRWVEVGLINGVDPRTAKALEEACLVEGVDNNGRYEIALRRTFE